MTTTRCPRCNVRLPRQLHFMPPSYGTPTVTGVIAFTSLYGGAFFAAFHLMWPPSMWPWPLASGFWHLVAGSVLFGLGLALEGAFVTSLFWYMERDRPRPAPTVRYDTETTIGGDIRMVSTREGQRRWLREQGFTIPPEPEQSALSRWLFAVHDGKCTLSQTGARTTIRNNPAVRQWAMDVMALFCKANWAVPRMGWNGDEPELGNGVDQVDMDIVYEVARGGMSRLIELLTAIVDESVEPTSPQTQNE